MRDLESRRAEIFRRSEQRIREIKRNRKRATAICLVLLLSVGSVSAAVYQPRKNNDNPHSQTLEYEDGAKQQFVKAVITDSSSNSYVCNDGDKIAELCAYAEDLGEIPKDTQNYDETLAESVVTKDESKITLTIEFIKGNGEKSVCTLIKNKLYFENGNKSVALSDEQLSSFLTTVEKIKNK